jgi:hypothetical protein
MMGRSADILASTLNDLLPDYEETFTKNHPLWERVRKNGKFNKRKLKGPQLLFDVLTGGPGYAATDRTGSTVLAGGRRQNLKQGNEDPARIIYYWNVPEKDLDEASTEYDFANLVENYGIPAMADVSERIAAQLARGASSAGTDANGGDVEGFLTLNGDQSYTPQDTTSLRSGVFQFAAIASQTNTVHGLPMSGAAANPTTGWYHQYGTISSFSVDGRKVMRTHHDKAMQEGAQFVGAMDLLIGDDGSYQNYADDLDDQIQSLVVEGDPNKTKVREGMKFKAGVFFPDPAIDITDTTAFTTAAARNGVIYGMTTADWEMIMIGPGNGDKIFRVGEPIPVSQQPLIQYRLTSYSNVFCKNLRRQMVITGGAQA